MFRLLLASLLVLTISGCSLTPVTPMPKSSDGFDFDSLQLLAKVESPALELPPLLPEAEWLADGRSAFTQEGMATLVELRDVARANTQSLDELTYLHNLLIAERNLLAEMVQIEQQRREGYQALAQHYHDQLLAERRRNFWTHLGYQSLLGLGLFLVL